MYAADTIKAKIEFEHYFDKLKMNRDAVPDIEQKAPRAYHALVEKVINLADKVAFLLTCDNHVYAKSDNAAQWTFRIWQAVDLVDEIEKARKSLVDDLNIARFYYYVSCIRADFDTLYCKMYWEPRCECYDNRFYSKVLDAWWNEDGWRKCSDGEICEGVYWPPAELFFAAWLVRVMSGEVSYFGYSKDLAGIAIGTANGDDGFYRNSSNMST